MTYDRIQNRRGTASQWTSVNPTLLSGELGVETDTGKLKVGDGSTAWASRNYAGGSTNASDLTSGTLNDARLSSNVLFKNSYTGQATYINEIKTVNNPEDVAPARFTNAQKLSFRKCFTHSYAWNNSSTIPTFGVGTDEMAFYWYRGYNVDASLPNEPSFWDSYESWFSNGTQVWQEHHLAEGKTKSNGQQPQQNFRCDSAMYPRERFDHPTHGVDITSHRGFFYQQIAFSPLSTTPASGQYFGSPPFLFDFRAQKQDFVLQQQAWIRVEVPRTPFMKQVGANAFVNLPHIDGEDRTVINSLLYTPNAIDSPSWISTDSAYRLGKIQSRVVAAADSSGGMFSGVNCKFATSVKAFENGNAYSLQTDIFGFHFLGKATATTNEVLPTLFEITGSEILSTKPLRIGTTQLRDNNGVLESYLPLSGTLGDFRAIRFYGDRADITDVYATTLRVGANQVPIKQNGFAIEVDAFLCAGAVAFGGSARDGTVAVKMSPDSSAASRIGLLVEQSASNNGDLIRVDSWAATRLVSVDKDKALSWKPRSSVTPDENGQLTFEATSNTSLTIKLKGSDGTVRSTSLTLS